jgi:heme exporter protein C
MAAKIQPWLNVGAVLTLAVGLSWGLFFAPADWQQHDAVRIMYVHVPAAWLASLGYGSIALASLVGYVWRHPLADMAAMEIGPVGAMFTAICLITGSLWGKPMWGAWWVWDARLTSVLILFFLYLGHIALTRAFDDADHGAAAGRILALLGVVILPVIKYSVVWWNSLHQRASISLTGSTMEPAILDPLLLCVLGFNLAFGAIVLARLRAAVIEQRIRAQLLARSEES